MHRFSASFLKFWSAAQKALLSVMRQTLTHITYQRSADGRGRTGASVRQGRKARQPDAPWVIGQTQAQNPVLLCPQRQDVDVLDLGTGNGALLVELARRGYRCLTGADFSAASVNLAAAVLEKHGLVGAVRLVVHCCALSCL